MPAKIVINVVLSCKEFVFDEPSSCIIGRAGDCSPKVPDDDANKTVSRHHCLLDINPPDIRIRDFGSRNGTYVNGQKIGQREKGMSPEQGAKMSFPQHDLKHGDEFRVGETVFRVDVFVPVRCEECSAEIPEDKKLQAEWSPGVFRCEACRKQAELAQRKEPLKKRQKVCVKCGRDVSEEVGGNRQGEYTCARCQKNPLDILKKMLDKAKAGAGDLQKIRGYSIQRELGRGGMGAVYLARHEGSGEMIALKVMLPKVAAEERAKEAFLREVSNTRALKHRNIVEFRESGCSGGTFFFTIEYCTQGSVDKLMHRRGGKLSIKEAMAILCDVLDGLDYAHHAPIPNVKFKDGHYARGFGFVHRDLSPHNILLADVRGVTVAKISDYGLGKAFDTAGLSGFTRTGAAAGKPWYMPRQQVVNFKYARTEVDVWAAAACLYAMLTGTTPRDFPDGKDVWQVVLDTEPVPIRRRDASIPSRLAEVIDKALIDRPEISFKSAADLKMALLAALPSPREASDVSEIRAAARPARADADRVGKESNKHRRNSENKGAMEQPHERTKAKTILPKFIQPALLARHADGLGDGEVVRQIIAKSKIGSQFLHPILRQSFGWNLLVVTESDFLFERIILEALNHVADDPEHPGGRQVEYRDRVFSISWEAVFNETVDSQGVTAIVDRIFTKAIDSKAMILVIPRTHPVPSTRQWFSNLKSLFSKHAVSCIVHLTPAEYREFITRDSWQHLVHFLWISDAKTEEYGCWLETRLPSVR